MTMLFLIVVQVSILVSLIVSVNKAIKGYTKENSKKFSRFTIFSLIATYTLMALGMILDKNLGSNLSELLFVISVLSMFIGVFSLFVLSLKEVEQKEIETLEKLKKFTIKS